MNYKELLENNNFIIDGDFEKIKIKDYFFDDTNVFNLRNTDILNDLNDLYEEYVTSNNEEKITIIISSLHEIFKSKEKEEIFEVFYKLLNESKIRFVLFDKNVISLPRKIKKFFKLTVYDKAYASRKCKYKLDISDITGITLNNIFYKVKEDYSLEKVEIENKPLTLEKINYIPENKGLMIQVYNGIIKNNEVSLNKISLRYGLGFNRAKRIVDNFIALGLIYQDNNKLTIIKSLEDAEYIINSI